MTLFPELPEVTLSELQGVRFLHLGTPWVQGAMRIAKPLKLELEYVRRMMVWLLLRPEAGSADPAVWKTTHTVQLGLGAAAITRFCHQVLGARATAVEINPSVIQAAHAWFHLPRQAPGLAVMHFDAGAFVCDPSHAQSADALCIDLYDHEAASPVLDSDAFYRSCHAVLSPGGSMTVNLFGRESSFERSLGRITNIFGVGNVFMVEPTKEGNSIVGGTKQLEWPQADVLAARAENLETVYQLPARSWLRILHR